MLVLSSRKGKIGDNMHKIKKRRESFSNFKKRCFYPIFANYGSDPSKHSTCDSVYFREVCGFQIGNITCSKKNCPLWGKE